MSTKYTKLEMNQIVASYFQANDYKNLYKDKCINFIGETKDTKENYSKVIVDYLVEHIDEFKKGLNTITVTRKTSYKTTSHTGKSDFDFNKQPRGERREEKIAHAKIEKRFYNDDLQKCLEQIESYIQDSLK